MKIFKMEHQESYLLYLEDGLVTIPFDMYTNDEPHKINLWSNCETPINTFAGQIYGKMVPLFLNAWNEAAATVSTIKKEDL